MKRFALGTAIFMACAFAPVGNGAVSGPLRDNTAATARKIDRLNVSLNKLAAGAGLMTAASASSGSPKAKLPKADTLVAGSQLLPSVGEQPPFKPDPITGLLMLAAFALIGSTLRERRHDGINLPQS